MDARARDAVAAPLSCYLSRPQVTLRAMADYESRDLAGAAHLARYDEPPMDDDRLTAAELADEPLPALPRCPECGWLMHGRHTICPPV